MPRSMRPRVKVDGLIADIAYKLMRVLIKPKVDQWLVLPVALLCANQQGVRLGQVIRLAALNRCFLWLVSPMDEHVVDLIGDGP